MTQEERIAALTKLGFTPRQAGFLATVLLISGVCVQRQYCAFAGISRGQVIRNFFAELINRRYATAYRCDKRDAQIFHSTTRPSTARLTKKIIATAAPSASRVPSNA